MSASLALRLLPAFFGALLITLAVFLFMRGLITMGQREEVKLAVYEDVQILRPQPEKKPPEDQREAPPEEVTEPVMEALAIAPPTAAPVQAPQVQALTPNLDIGDIAVPGADQRWTAPVAGSVANFGAGAQDARGFVEVVPYNTRKPNVPDVAWQNKISGWVLVAFTVTPDGNTRDVRVLDARPRGVFEEKVIAAVEDWQYSLNFKSRDRANLVLTQRVEVRWQDYPQNIPYVD